MQCPRRSPPGSQPNSSTGTLQHKQTNAWLEESLQEAAENRGVSFLAKLKSMPLMLPKLKATLRTLRSTVGPGLGQEFSRPPRQPRTDDSRAEKAKKISAQSSARSFKNESVLVGITLEEWIILIAKRPREGHLLFWEYWQLTFCSSCESRHYVAERTDWRKTKAPMMYVLRTLRNPRSHLPAGSVF